MGTRISVLIENQSEDSRLVCEHGLAYLIEHEGRKIVFDTGQSGDFIRNAQVMGIDLKDSTDLVLSHGHYDHVGGVAAFLEINPRLAVWAHPNVSIERYSIKDPEHPKMIGMPASVAERLAMADFHQTVDRCSLGDRVWLSGEVPRETDFEDTGGPFFLDKYGKVEDPIADDFSLYVQSDRGLIIVLGCAHAGLVNIVEDARRKTGVESVYGIIGGMHLLHACAQRLSLTMDFLGEIQPKLLAPCHCTGDAVVDLMRESFPDAFQRCGGGTVFEV
jgi:7,8-dihydropterin-6-yl-methyl-4-(beta-D-ribofuranosyl)aminobenzene 5'-phosphate synthase